MITPLLLFSLGLPVDWISLQCGSVADMQTKSVRNAQGTTVSLRLRDEDDHGKNTHLCESQYAFEMVYADGSTVETDWDNGNDAEWGRRIKFGLRGFTAGGEVVALISEGGRFPNLQVLVYGLKVQDHSAYTVDGRLLKQLGAGCAQALDVKGLTAQNEVVIGTRAAAACTQQKMWRVTKRKTDAGANVTEPLPAGTFIMPLVRPARVRDERQ